MSFFLFFGGALGLKFASAPNVTVLVVVDVFDDLLEQVDSVVSHVMFSFSSLLLTTDLNLLPHCHSSHGLSQILSSMPLGSGLLNLPQCLSLLVSPPTGLSQVAASWCPHFFLGQSRELCLMFAPHVQHQKLHGGNPSALRFSSAARFLVFLFV